MAEIRVPILNSSPKVSCQDFRTVTVKRSYLIIKQNEVEIYQHDQQQPPLRLRAVDLVVLKKDSYKHLGDCIVCVEPSARNFIKSPSGHLVRIYHPNDHYTPLGDTSQNSLVIVDYRTLVAATREVLETLIVDYRTLVAATREVLETSAEATTGVTTDAPPAPTS